MLETERHRIILSAVGERPVVTVSDLCALTGASEATVRRDIAQLHLAKKLRRVRGGAEAVAPPVYAGINAPPFAVNQVINIAQKRAIAQAAVDLCADGDAIIINGGTTTFQMVHPLTTKRLQVFTNSFPIAEHLLKQSKNTVLVPAGAIYREQNIILSPFDEDGSNHFYARRMFIGCRGLNPLGLMEGDPLLVQAEQKLIDQADELVVLADSSKFRERSSLLLCPLTRIHTVITDDGIEDGAAQMLEAAEVRLIVVKSASDRRKRAGK
ncbi:DeoR/GlpR family DNA-binding transcription regulator [Paracoccus benzoatiresistens]|uniref:DeoR/GlpR family DNA-binding transcription regulator n=1 Tax=Paracoccus benzoatiresistens TaxID=2997341 RepID=A0ABT4J9K6_9RHOB|nr:DeoR/GlpR family DNA-binding transcription regulator [Paracoccus sp. EF6]MCZ0963282.1 DeoR/GlpR family DNA-binding transcription regulator [Paracoccus sp. EF6]